MKGANLEKVGVRLRERREKVGRDKVGQPFARGEEERRRLNWGGAGAELDHPCSCCAAATAAAPCFHSKLHRLLLLLRKTK